MEWVCKIYDTCEFFGTRPDLQSIRVYSKNQSGRYYRVSMKRFAG